MKKFAKKMLSLLLMGVLTFSLVACGEDDASKKQKDDNSKSAGGRTKITFWHIIPKGSDGYDSFDELINNFNKAQDKYEVSHVGYPFMDYFNKMTTALAGGEAPDVFLYTLDDVPNRAAAGTTANLSTYMNEEKYDTSDLYEGELDSGSYNGDYYAVPFSSTCRMLWYNLDMFKAAGLTEEDVPTTWKELSDVAHKMDIVEDGVIQQLGFDPTAGQSNYFSFLWTAGLDFFDEDGNPLLDQPEQEKVLQWMADFNKEYPQAQRQAFSDVGETLAADGFASGRLSMMIGNDQEYATLKNGDVDFEYGVAPIPIPDENGVRCNWSSSWSLEATQSKDEDKMAGAWAFIKYMLEPDSMEAFYKSQGWLTASKTANERFQNDDITSDLINELPYSREKKYFDFAPKWQADWDQFQDLANKGTSVDEVLKKAQKFYLEKRTNFEKTQGK